MILKPYRLCECAPGRTTTTSSFFTLIFQFNFFNDTAIWHQFLQSGKHHHPHPTLLLPYLHHSLCQTSKWWVLIRYWNCVTEQYQETKTNYFQEYQGGWGLTLPHPAQTSWSILLPISSPGLYDQNETITFDFNLSLYFVIAIQINIWASLLALWYSS